MNSDILKIAKETLLTEAKTIKDLVNVLDDSFLEILDLLYHCNGRIIITGMGKSALIAQKIVATLNSTGSPSIYMHAGDAVHGDMGMVTKSDLLICLSKSGHTSELQLIIPFVKSQGTKIIAICSEPECYLMQNCDHSIYIPLDQEAEPNNIVPTASTTAQLAIGDAIAVSLLSMRGFSPKDFASFHPGGSLGKQLFLKVSDLYSKNEKPAVSPSSDLKSIIIEMTSKRLGATADINDASKILGIITDGDLRRMLHSEKDLSIVTAGEIMTPNPISVENDDLAYSAFKLIREKSITQVLVAKDGKYDGIVHLHDFINEGFI